MPLPVGVSVAISSRSNLSCSRHSLAHSRGGAQIAGGADLHGHVAFRQSRRNPIADRHRPAIDVKRHMRVRRQHMFAGDRLGPGDRGAAGMHGGDQAGVAGRLHMGCIVHRVVERAEPRLGEPDALFRHVR